MGPLGVTILYDPETKAGLQVEEGHHPASFDIVGVHGLNGDSYNTWTHGETGKLWLRDMLPMKLPRARIMTYGYNAKFANFTSTHDLYSIASKLLSELVDFRRTDEQRKRPIVFICHSLGGIVTKKALVIRPTDNQQTAVQQSTYGIIFMGTPHCGSDLASYGRSIANIVSVCTPMNPATRLLKNLSKDSNALFELSREFASQMGRLSIVTFFEMNKTSFVLRRQMVVDKGSAILRASNEVAIGQYANHVQITKFADDKDTNYRPVLVKLLEFAESISKKTMEVIAKNLCLSGEDHQPSVSPPFEVPMLKDFKFRGRGDVLARIDEFFSQPPPEASKPLVYIITGLGGAGKTQTAIQYAHIHSKRYGSGVFFINASSATSIQVSADRILSLVKSPSEKAIGGDNRIGDLAKWLEQKGEWLLIFDGADDLDALSLRTLFPKSGAGHIMVTTRDQAAHVLISKYGTRIEEMDKDGAVQALLDKGMARLPSTAEIATAKRIVQLLGYLPLAIDQAGAYMTARDKTLSEYEMLFRQRSSDLLKAHPRMAAREQMIQTVWEMNFNQLESTSSDATMLLSLFAFLEPSEILVDMLKRGCSNKNTWNQHGQVTETSAVDAGVDRRLVDLITDELRFDAAVDSLLAFSLVWRARTIEGLSAIALHPLVQLYAAGRATDGNASYWPEQAVLLICQSFPCSMYLQPGFGTIGRRMFAQIPAVLNTFDKIKDKVEHKVPTRRAVITMLLSASQFNTRDHKTEMLNRAKSLLPDQGDAELKTLTVSRESTLLRLRGQNERSYTVLRDHIHKLSQSPQGSETPLNPRTNAQRGELVISYASNLLSDSKSDEAAMQLEAWQPLNPETPSVQELEIARQKHVILGRALRNDGRFREAIVHFEELSKHMNKGPTSIRSSWHRHLYINLSDLYCEVGLPLRAVKLLRPELEYTLSRKLEKTPQGIDILLCCAEALIRKGDSQPAVELLSELATTLERIEKPDMLTSTRHFRVHAGLARISHLKEHWIDAEMRWYRTFDIIESNEWHRTFNEAITLLSLAQVLYRLGQVDQAEAYRKQAEASMQVEGRKYWMVGLGSYWYEFVKAPLGETGPDPRAQETVSPTDDMSDLMGMVREWATAEELTTHL